FDNIGLSPGTGHYVQQVQVRGVDRISCVSILIAPETPQPNDPPWLSSFGDTGAPLLGEFSLGGPNQPTITAVCGTCSASAVTSLEFYFSDDSVQTFGPGGGNDFIYDIPSGTTFGGFGGIGDASVEPPLIVALGIALYPSSQTAA